MSEKRFYVYTLAYPESMGGKVFYVGKGTGSRISHHERLIRTEYAPSMKGDVIRAIWQAGGKVVRAKVYENLSSKEAAEKEKQLIKAYGERNLTNGNWLYQRKREKAPIDKIRTTFVSLSVLPYMAHQIGLCMALDGIDQSHEDLLIYVKDVCKTALQEHIDRRLGSSEMEKREFSEKSEIAL